MPSIFNGGPRFSTLPKCHEVFPTFPMIREFGPKYAPMKQRVYDIGTINPTFSLTARICRLTFLLTKDSLPCFFADNMVKTQMIMLVMKSNPKHRKAVFRVASKVIATLRNAACLQPISWVHVT